MSSGSHRPAPADGLGPTTQVFGAPSPGASDRAPAFQPFDVVGNYHILKRLGGGGMAEVYLARLVLGERVEKMVAFKTVLPAFVANPRHATLFLNEARISATLQHANVVQVVDFGEAAGRPYLAMEFVHGRDLAQHIQRRRIDIRPPSLDFGLAVAIDVCRALEYVHEKKDLDGRALNLVHRDVSPQNVLLSPRGEVRLVDFGVAAAAGDATGAPRVMGKYAYMAPDQLAGRPPHPGWDLYALGAVLYEMLTLEGMFPTQSLDVLLDAKRRAAERAPSVRNPQVPAVLDEVVRRATDPDPARRPASARALRQALEEARGVVGPGDVGAAVRELFGPHLAGEEAELERLVGESRRRHRGTVPAPLEPLLRPLRSVRRRVTGTRLYLRLARYPWAMRSAVGVLLFAAAAGAASLFAVHATASEFERRVALADERIAAGRLAGPGGDQALDHLLALRKLDPGDARVAARLLRLADAFEELGARALERARHAEAAVHFQAALKADPDRADAREKLRQVEQQIRTRSRARFVPDR